MGITVGDVGEKRFHRMSCDGFLSELEFATMCCWNVTLAVITLVTLYFRSISVLLVSHSRCLAGPQFVGPQCGCMFLSTFFDFLPPFLPGPLFSLFYFLISKGLFLHVCNEVGRRFAGF